VVLRGQLARSRSRQVSQSNSYTHYDPDGDGLGRTGGALVNDWRDSITNYSATKDQPSLRAGVSLDLRSRRRSADAEGGWLCVLSFLPSDVETTRQTGGAPSSISTGGTVTTTYSLQNQTITSGNANRVLLTYSRGERRKISPRCWLGVAARADVDLSLERSETRVAFSTATGAPGLNASSPYEQDTLSSVFRLPVHLEIQPTRSLSLWASVSPSLNITQDRIRGQSAGTFPDYSVTSGDQYTSAEWGLGVGYKWRQVEVQGTFVTGSSQFYFNNMGQVQLIYRFGAKSEPAEAAIVAPAPAVEVAAPVPSTIEVPAARPAPRKK
jgi:hypothetical protein